MLVGALGSGLRRALGSGLRRALGSGLRRALGSGLRSCNVCFDGVGKHRVPASPTRPVSVFCATPKTQTCRTGRRPGRCCRRDARVPGRPGRTGSPGSDQRNRLELRGNAARNAPPAGLEPCFRCRKQPTRNAMSKAARSTIPRLEHRFSASKVASKHCKEGEPAPLFSRKQVPCCCALKIDQILGVMRVEN